MSAFRLTAQNGIEWFEAAELAGIPWLVHAFSTRRCRDGKDTEMNFTLGAPDGVDTAPVRANRRKFMAAIGAANFKLAAVRQIHSDRIFEVSIAEDGGLTYVPPGGQPPNLAAEPCQGDALFTRQPGILLSIRTADCVPILFADLKQRAVAAVHAGWRGLLNRIVEKSVGEMRRSFGSQPPDLRAAVGPAIGVCCYQVGPEVADAFSETFANADEFIERPSLGVRSPHQAPMLGFLSHLPPGHDPGSESAFKLNLTASARAQLQAAGIPENQIAISGDCTACQSEQFFSYRKQGSRAGRMMAVIGIRP